MTAEQLELPLFHAGIQKCTHCSGVLWQNIHTQAWTLSTWNGATEHCQDSPDGRHDPRRCT